MKLLVVAAVVGTLATPVCAQGSVEPARNVDDRPFQCGAAFAIMAEVYKAAGNAELSTAYATKFDRLSAQAESIFAQTNRSKSDAQAYMQQHVDNLAGVAEKNARQVIAFARVCDRDYPS